MRKEVALWSCAVLLILGTMSRAEEQRPYIGLSLDLAPLPDLLTKHLRLDPGQGIRINNIMIGSPADRAGLERDDIVFVFQGQKVTGTEQFTGIVRKAGVGTVVTLELVHLGQRKTVQVSLESAPEPKAVQWKYKMEPDVVTSWRPGWVSRIGPDGQTLERFSFDKIPGANLDLKKLFKQSYTYHHSTGGEDYAIMIEGDPADPEARVIVESGDQKHTTTVGSLDSLPEKYRAPVKEAVENAKTSLKTDIRIELPDAFGSDVRQRLFRSFPRPDVDRLLEQKDQALERLQGQMERLQQRMKEMEDRNREMIDKLLQRDQTNKAKTSESQTLTPSEPKQKQAI